jgi:hypothetical protein
MRLLFVLLLTGCVASQWAKPGAGSRDFYRDDDLCVAQARPSPKGALEKPTYDACMVARGWQRK